MTHSICKVFPWQSSKYLLIYWFKWRPSKQPDDFLNIFLQIILNEPHNLSLKLKIVLIHCFCTFLPTFWLSTSRWSNFFLPFLLMGYWLFILSLRLQSQYTVKKCLILAWKLDTIFYSVHYHNLLKFKSTFKKCEEQSFFCKTSTKIVITKFWGFF